MHVREVTFLSCGWALASKQTHGTSVALATDTGITLVDGGGNVAQRLLRAYGFHGLEAIYLTHEHPDHTWGLPGLIHCLRFAGERGPLPIHGPEPALERLRRALDALGVETPFELAWHPIKVERGGNHHVTWAPGDHSVPALSYRFDDVVVCADTRPADATVELACQASLLIHEASHTDAERTHRAGHSTPADAGTIARRAQVDTLAVIHVHPSLPLEQARDATGFEPSLAPVDGQRATRHGPSWQLEG